MRPVACRVGCAILLGSPVLFAQTPMFSSRVDAVRVDALVTEGRQQPVLGLKAEDFEVLDDGVPQRVELAVSERWPLHVVLAVDLSDSVAGERLAQIRAAGHAVIDDLKRDDRAALLTFSAAVSLRATLTPDLASVRAAIDDASGGGDTSLVDASYSALVLGEADDARALVIVFSDGADTGSFLTPAAVLSTAARTAAVVYGVSAGDAPTAFLDDLCHVTGGRVLSVQSTDKLREAFLGILDEFRQRYVLSYVPRGVAKDGWHRLDVRVKSRRVTVKARPGYLAGS
jgi:Ca-activated chloride channel homolog